MGPLQWITPSIATIDGFLPPETCEALIARGEAIGFEQAPIGTEVGALIVPEVRNNARVILDDEALAGDLWARLAPAWPAMFGTTWRAIGLNERLRFYRYHPGQRFDWHIDGHFARPTGERSFFTFMVYLNDGYAGGETIFSDRAERDHPRHIVAPRQGMALLFRHILNHTGSAVERGCKYVLRSDVMYRDVPATTGANA